jgi:SAM-dependent methyltransferase
VDESDLLHEGGPPGRWGNLGWWPLADADRVPYRQAAEALARRVGQAAGLRAGERVLSIACGRGEELRLWIDAFAAAQVTGMEPHPASLREARELALHRQCPGTIEVLAGPAGLAWPAGVRFDRVVCVDAAYHVSPRTDLLRAALSALCPGGSLAYTDLVIDDGLALVPAARRWPRTARAVAGRHGLDLDEIVTTDAAVRRLLDLGARDVRAERLDDAVLGGFVRFVSRQSRAIGWRRFSPAWWRVAGTAAWLPSLRQRGLGYALFSARAPQAPDTPSASPRVG